MKKLLLLLALVIPMVSFAQLIPNNEDQLPTKKVETKYEKYLSNYGKFIRFAKYDMAKLSMQGDWISDTKIVEFVDINTEKKDYFIVIRCGRAEDIEIIAYEDFCKVLDALAKLKQKLPQDKQIGSYLEFSFITDDGMRIGYFFEKNNPTWFITVNGNIRKFKKGFDFEKAFNELKNKIEELKTK